MKECSFCYNLGIDSLPDSEYGEIIFLSCYSSDKQSLSETNVSCPSFVKCDEKYFEHELWENLYGGK